VNLLLLLQAGPAASRRVLHQERRTHSEQADFAAFWLASGVTDVGRGCGEEDGEKENAARRRESAAHAASSRDSEQSSPLFLPEGRHTLGLGRVAEERRISSSLVPFFPSLLFSLSLGASPEKELVVGPFPRHYFTLAVFSFERGYREEGRDDSCGRRRERESESERERE